VVEVKSVLLACRQSRRTSLEKFEEAREIKRDDMNRIKKLAWLGYTFPRFCEHYNETSEHYQIREFLEQ
jgi:hypothetical protein